MKKEKINPETVAKPAAPYSGIVKISESKGLLFFSGVSAITKDYEVVGKGDILTQTKKIIENINLSLEAAGAEPKNVVMTTTYVLSEYMDDFLMSGASSELFTAFDNPADTLVGVANLAGAKYGAMIEVSAVAAVD